LDKTEDFAWLSLLQKRADYARKSAAGARTPGIAKGLGELAALYDGIAGRAEADFEKSSSDGSSAPRDGRDILIQQLMSRSLELLSQARNPSDKKRADELKYLAGVYGAEAARIKTDRMR
jgi:hypothetical protein